ncbi:hypothetical protein [Sporisorium scitamineum]|uniref:Uncharacterized protein n=1 Tax=Sporisorium scitamineum TaxID=49012 RepID=A0A0F7RZK5_9BASI|nr:hypothetical protein [Sporisorium scitamineum]
MSEFDDTSLNKSINTSTARRMSSTASATFVNDGKVGTEQQTLSYVQKIRRSQPVSGRPDQVSGAAQSLIDPTGGREPVKVRSRKRPVDENARRGESKIGRATQLRPGRLTFRLDDARTPP